MKLPKKFIHRPLEYICLCPYSEFFWFVFSRIRTEHGDLRKKSFRIQSKCGKIRTRKTPNTDTFCAVKASEN